RGELAAIGAESLTRRGKSKTDKRVPLDMAREAAEEAGYIGVAGEVQTTSVADLLDAIDQELRGNPVFSRADDAAGWAAAYAGPAVDDAIVREAAEISLRDGVDVLDALESVLVRRADEPGQLPIGRDAEPLPGWSDAELDAASAGRGLEPMPENGSP
ncbi:hypothetical protein, partial [Mesorhizobium sp.]|uniref:hypothetical protein n=1 Tax=Mesorhizobium sp. TaxID=1871066 RepID=UPI00257C7575